MVKNSPNIGTGTITTKNDPRILPFGVFLRRTKINELPQLLNVFLGDMSLIGPRPLTTQNFRFYSEKQQIIIGKVKPGLSGLGSILFRNEEQFVYLENNPVDFYANTIAPYKGSIEEWYVKNKRIWMYFALIFLTIWVVLSPSSKVLWKVFKELPLPPSDLCIALNYERIK
jgi:lipopolysaccharide/colanic/teichoic acid biosynthesis glycosyltransferase